VDLGEEFRPDRGAAEQVRQVPWKTGDGTLARGCGGAQGVVGGRANPGTLSGIASCHSITIHNDSEWPWEEMPRTWPAWRVLAALIPIRCRL